MQHKAIPMQEPSMDKSAVRLFFSYFGYLGLNLRIDCGMSIEGAATTAPSADCSSACSGNATQPCGGGNRLNLYWSGTTGPQTNPGPGLWKFAGCYT